MNCFPYVFHILLLLYILKESNLINSLLPVPYGIIDAIY